MTKPSSRLWRTRALVLAGAVIAADQISKIVMMRVLDGASPAIEVTPFFNLVTAWNRGVSFGLFNSEGPWNAVIFSVLAAVIVLVLLVWLFRGAESLTAAAIGLIIGGAAGNVIDRLRFGAVFDFLDVHAFGWHWPAFNIADAAITIGALALVWDGLSAGGESPKIKKS
ncbi:MAG: signal peptidase II [Rhodospirillales bacterium]